MVFEVQLDLFDDLVFVRAVRVQPEDGGHAGVARAGNRQFDPVANRCVLDLAHAPDVAFFDVLRQQHLAGGDVHNARFAGLGHFKGFVVRAVLFSLLGHQADIGHGAHGDRVKVAIGLAEVNDFLVDARKGTFGIDRLGVLGLAVGAPHFAAQADHGGHRGVHNHVVGCVQVGDALGRVDHGQLGPVLVAGVQITDDLVALGGRQAFELFVEVGQPVVDVHAQLLKQLAVLGKGVFVVNPNRVTEHDGVRDLHHGGFDVQRQHEAGLARVFHLLFIEFVQRFLAHEHAVNDLAGFERDLGFEHRGFTGRIDQFHAHVAGFVQRHGLFTVIEVALFHVRHMGA